jgi:heavy metal sensor kinase
VSLSIRWRLTLWNVLAMTAVLAAVGGLVYRLLEDAHTRIDRALYRRVETLQEQTDKVLFSELRQLQDDQRLAAVPVARLKYWVYEFKEHDNVLAIVYDASGHVLVRTEELPEASVLPASAAPADPVVRDTEVPIVGRQRVLTAPVQLGPETVTVVLMTSLAELDRARREANQEDAEVHHEFQQLFLILLTSIPGALLLVGGLGYYLARKALAPMEKLHRLTEQVTAERLDLRLPVSNPGDELGRLTQTINAMIARLDKSFEEIRRFTADASHELRTPLAAIRTEAEVALARPLAVSDYQNLLGSILEEVERLGRLTDQLLTLTREESRGYAPTLGDLDLASLLENVVEHLRPLAEHKGQRLHLQVEEALLLRGDESRLRQVFFNLVDNAVKYTPEGGTVEVCAKEEGRWVKAIVRDTGIGIPAEHLPHVFERFYRVNKARDRDGTGLGLSIARSIITAHAGTMSLTSVPGEGTMVTVTLPTGKLNTRQSANYACGRITPKS